MAANDTLNTLADPERASELFASPYSPRRHAERAAAVLGEMSDALRELFADADPDAPTHPADAERGTFCENRSFDLWIDAADGDSVNVSAGLRGCIWDMYTCLASFLGWTLARLG